jgi:hypothetical protein
MTFKPAEWTTATNLVSWAMVIVFLVTLILSFWGAHFWARIICPIVGVLIIARAFLGYQDSTSLRILVGTRKEKGSACSLHRFDGTEVNVAS